MADNGINEYDTGTTLLYKTANRLQLPVRFLRIVSGLDVVNENLDPKTIVRNALATVKIESVVEYLRSNPNLSSVSAIFPKMSPDDIIYSYLLVNSNLSNSLPLINEFLRFKNLTNISSTNELSNRRQTLEMQIRNSLSQDLEVLEGILSIQQELQNIPDQLTVSKLEIDKVTLSVSPLLSSGSGVSEVAGVGNSIPNGTGVPNPEDGIEIFDAAIVDFDIPLIVYRTYYKVFKGEIGKSTPNFNLILSQFQTQVTEVDNDTLYIVVWIGTDPKKINKSSYIIVEYSLKINSLTIETLVEKVSNEDVGEENESLIILTKIGNNFPLTFDENNRKITKLSGEFYIYNLEYDEVTLADAILNDATLPLFLFLEESTHSLIEKKRLEFHYREVTEGLREEGSSDTAVSDITGKNYVFTSKLVNFGLNQISESVNSYILVDIRRAVDKFTAYSFMVIFPKLLQIYLNKKEEITKIYTGLIPGIRQLLIPQPVSEVTKKKLQTIDQGEQKATTILRNKAPDLIVSNYHRVCQTEEHKPLIVSDQEAVEWSKTRQVMRFPISSSTASQSLATFPQLNQTYPETWNFVCPNEKFRYPGLKENKILSNKDRYPCVPCCFGSNQIDSETSTMNTTCKGIEKPTTSKVAIKTGKVLDPGRIGTFLTPQIPNLLKLYPNLQGEPRRLGVVESPNSAIHCVLTAIGLQDYLNANETVKEDLAKRHRLNMLQRIYPFLLKQELYDVEPEEIVRMVGDTSSFFDPDLFFRALEEYFTCNIYVFTDLDEMSLPRHKIFSTREFRNDKATIILYKHMGTESSDLEYPQCELIIDYVSNERMIKIFLPTKDSMNSILYSTFLESYQTLTYSISENIIARKNIYSSNNFIPQNTKFAQYIDDYGKKRITAFKVSNIDFYVVTLPGQPENLPLITNITPPKIDDVLALMNNYVPTSVSLNENGNVNGIWYPILDIPEGVNFLIKEISTVEASSYINPIVIGSKIPINLTNQTNLTNRLKKLKKTNDLILQIIWYLYLLSKSKLSGEAPLLRLEEFITYLFVQSTSIDSSFEYDFAGKLPKILPEMNFDQSLKYLNERIPSLVVVTSPSYKIRLYNQKYYESVIFFLKFSINNTAGLEIPIPRSFSQTFFQTPDESFFTSSFDTIVFLKESDFRVWLSKQNLDNVIRKELKVEDQIRRDPYIYTDKINTYLIQNVEGDRNSALQVAFTWYSQKINLSYNAIANEVNEVINYDHVVYGIGSNFQITPISKFTTFPNSTNFLQILNYGNSYAAMLPLV